VLLGASGAFFVAPDVLFKNGATTLQQTLFEP
jgi:hypothetical protein